MYRYKKEASTASLSELTRGRYDPKHTASTSPHFPHVHVVSVVRYGGLKLSGDGQEPPGTAAAEGLLEARPHSPTPPPCSLLIHHRGARARPPLHPSTLFSDKVQVSLLYVKKKSRHDFRHNFHQIHPQQRKDVDHLARLGGNGWEWVGIASPVLDAIFSPLRMTDGVQVF